MDTINTFLSSNLGLLLGSIIIGTLSTWAARSLAWKIDFLDKPKANVPQHTKSIAYLGGVGIFLGIVISNYFFNAGLPLIFLIFGGVFMALGLIDDKVELRPLHKFLIQVVAAVGAAKYCASFSFFGIEILDLLLSAFWYLVLLNAFNLTDVCDGLLGGISTVIFLFAAIAFPESTALWLLIAGSIIGFLVFNSPPASIFMGDAGSHLLGYIAAYMTMSTSSILPNTYSFYILACLCAVPLFEITFLVVVRYRKGLAWWLSSKDHFALRLQRHGYTKWMADITAYVLSIIAGLPMLYFIFTNGITLKSLLVSILILAIVFLTFWWYLIRIEKQDNLKDMKH